MDDTSKVHWYLYSEAMGPKYRVSGRRAWIFWDGVLEESKSREDVDILEYSDFAPIEYQALFGKYSIFDAYHDFEHAKRAAHWKKRTSNLLTLMAETVLHELSDAAPQLGDKLYGAMVTFERAETSEELAQVLSSCRRIVEYVTDQIFPPKNKAENDHKLGALNFRNRLLAFAEGERKSETNIGLISARLNLWSDQIEKLNKLANKGVHAEVIKPEAKRCLVHTVLLLDDIVSFRSKPFDFEGHITKEKLKEFIGEDD